MKNNEQYEPQAEHKFSFGLWTLGNRGRDPFGDFVRPVISPIEIVRTLGEVGAWGVNLHDDALVPIDAARKTTISMSTSLTKSTRSSAHETPNPMSPAEKSTWPPAATTAASYTSPIRPRSWASIRRSVTRKWLA